MLFKVFRGQVIRRCVYVDRFLYSLRPMRSELIVIHLLTAAQHSTHLVAVYAPQLPDRSHGGFMITPDSYKRGITLFAVVSSTLLMSQNLLYLYKST